MYLMWRRIPVHLSHGAKPYNVGKLLFAMTHIKILLHNLVTLVVLAPPQVVTKTCEWTTDYLSVISNTSVGETPYGEHANPF